MKTLKWIAPCAWLAFLIAAFLGCEPDLGTAPPYFEPMTVSVYAYEDTLPVPCTPHVSTPGFAMVCDRAGRAMRGVAVDLAVTPPELGWIEYADSVLQDTTNDQGRVDFIFYALGEPGNAIITACVGSTCDSFALALLEAHLEAVASVVLTLDKDTLWLAPGSTDSVLATLCQYDTAGIVIPIDTCSSGNGIPGVSIRLSVTGGRFRPFTAADSSGCVHCWWFLSWERGEFCCWACVAGFCDSACVFVDSL